MRSMNKKNGSILKMLPVLIGIAAVSVLSLMYITYMDIMDRREMVFQISREYLLRMETEGYLTDEAAKEMISEIEKTGAVNINLAGTTLSKSEYGKEITLSIDARIPMNEMALTDLFNIDTDRVYKRLHIVKKTTAKN